MEILGLIVALVLITVVAFKYVRYEVLHPWFIISVMMLLSAMLTFVGSFSRPLLVSAKACIIVISAVIVFGIGGLIIGQSSNKREIKILRKEVDISFIATLIITIAMIVGIVLYVTFLYDLSLSLGNTQGPSNMIRTIRLANEKGVLPSIRWISYTEIISTSIAYVYTYVFISRILGRIFRKRDIVLLLPVLCFFPYTLLSGGRLGMLSYVIFVLTVSGILYLRQHSFSIVAKKKLAKSFFITGVLFVIIFLLMGTFTGKISLANLDIMRVLVHYGGLSFPALSVALDKTPVLSPYIGQYTLWDIYRRLGDMGLDLPKGIIFLKFVRFNDLTTNVYTAMYRYINDYGFMGMYMIMFLLGSLYTFLYERIKNTANELFAIAYGFLSYPLFLMMNDDLFFSHVFVIATLYKIAFVTLLYKVLIRDKSRSE